jgi:serine/alanine adding enzyme
MSHGYELIWDDAIDVHEWELLLKKSSQASYFQSPKGFAVLRKFDDWEVRVLGLRRNGNLHACVVFVIQAEKGVKKFFSKRCIVFSGPLYTNQDDLSALLTALNKSVSGSIYIEVRNGYSFVEDGFVFRKLQWKYTEWLNFIVDTTDLSILRKRISEGRLRQIKKAEKKGVQFMNPSKLSEVESFYQILQGLYKRKVKKPLPTWNLFQLHFEADRRNFVLVFFESKVIGGIFCPFLEDVGAYEFYVAGLDEEFKDCYPSAMATYGAMVKSFEMGLPKFDFMGGGNPSEGYGVREFKARFGGAEVELGRWLKVRRPFLYWLGSKYIQFRSK